MDLGGRSSIRGELVRSGLWHCKTPKSLSLKNCVRGQGSLFRLTTARCIAIKITRKRQFIELATDGLEILIAAGAAIGSPTPLT
jgi:hypothetical protein